MTKAASNFCWRRPSGSQGCWATRSRYGSQTRGTRNTNNTTPEDLVRMAAAMAGKGLLTLSAEKDGGPEFAAAAPALLAREAEFRARLQQALDLTKPAFNEEMRAGHTNM